ncbi:hypothetical protein BU17DRAFT_103886 [Hysterangium stoloniferum]|nr:hypothetical protein BU17DRAFT_103886 [Hysterangium stoloniferum]
MLPSRSAPMGMLARLSLKEACVVSKPGSSTSTSSSTIKSEECSEANLKRAATYDEDDFQRNSNLQPMKDLVLLRQVISPQGLPPTSHRRVLGTRGAPPAILSSGYVSVSSVYPSSFQKTNVYSAFCYLSALRIHSKPRSPHCPKRSTNGTCSSSPPTVLAISSRYLLSCPRLHNIAMNFPEYAAATAFIDGWGFFLSSSPFSDGYTGVALDLENDTLQYLRRMRKHHTWRPARNRRLENCIIVNMQRRRVKQTLQRCKGAHEIDEPAAAGYGRRAGSCLEVCETTVNSARRDGVLDFGSAG